MRPNNIIAIIIIFLFTINRISGQCNEDAVLDYFVIYDEGVIEFSDSTTNNSGNNFSVSDMIDAGGFNGNDRIYKLTLEDNDGDGDADDTLNLFIDLCQSGVTFDASIGIIQGYPGINCNEIERDELIIPHPAPNFDEDGGFDENVDAGVLCPTSSDVENPSFLPIARDVYLDEVGDYYIVIDGHNESDSGNFTITIGEMLTFSDYQLNIENEIVEYIYIEFSDDIFRVDNQSDWTLTAPNLTNFDFKYNGDPIGYDKITDSGGNDIVNEEYLNSPFNEFRFYISSASVPVGSEVTIVPTDEENWGPSPVNLYGIPFASEDTLIIEVSVPTEITGLSELGSNNESVKVTFSVGVYSDNGTGGVEIDDFNIQTSPQDLAPAILQITKVGSTLEIPSGGEDELIFHLSINPSTGSDSVHISANVNSVFSSEGIPMSEDAGLSLQLNDLIAPIINIASMSSDDPAGFIHPDTSFYITSTEPLEIDDSEITELVGINIGNYITIEPAEILVEITVIDNRTIEVNPQSSMQEYEWQEIVVTLSNEYDGLTIKDAAGNPIETKISTIRVNDVFLPTINSASIDGSTNSLITVVMSEPVYESYNELGGVGGLNQNHFELSITPNESNNIQSVTIENVIQEGSNQLLLGGETSFRIQMFFDPLYASGSEIITISPSSNPIYDQAGNQVSNQQTVILNDELPPLVLFYPEPNTSIVPNTEFILSFSEPVIIGTSIDLVDQDGEQINYGSSLNADNTILTIVPSEGLNELDTLTLSYAGDYIRDESGNFISSTSIEYFVTDVTPPSFESDELGRGNDYVKIIMSEGVYTDANMAGGLNMDDFSLFIVENEAGAESISIESITDESGGILQGGQNIIRINLSIIGTTNGSEKIIVRPALNQIYDALGNVMSANESTSELTLEPAPVFSSNSGINLENSFIHLIFENGPVFANEANGDAIEIHDFIVQLTNSDGVISEIIPYLFSIVDEAGSPILPLPVEANFVKLGINLDFIPDGSETIIVSPVSSNAIYNDQGVNMDESESTDPFTLNDQLAPSYNINIADGDIIAHSYTIIVSFSEEIRLLGEGELTDDSAEENFEIWDVSRTYDIIGLDEDGNTTITPANEPIEYYPNWFITRVNHPSVNDISVIMEHPFRSESNMSITIKSNFEDMYGNQLEEEDSTITFKASDNIPPDFISGSAIIDSDYYLSVQENPSELERDICKVNLSIDDNVFTDESLTDPVQAGDFIVGINQNGGSVSSGDIEYVELVDNGVPEVDEIQFTIRFDEIPSGSESLFISPAGEFSICDDGLNFMNADSKSDELVIGDLRFPTIASTSIPHEGYIDLMSVSEIMVYFSEPINTNTLDYDFISTSDGSGFNHTPILSEDFLQIVFDDRLISSDTLDLTINHLEDISGNIKDGLIKRSFFTKVAGDFFPEEEPDNRVCLDDANEFIKGWESSDYSKNLGPYEGTPPNIKITQDNLFGIDDGMAFTQMYLWSLQTFGLCEVVQDPLVNLPSSILYSDNAISIMPPDSALSGQVMINYDVTDYQIHSGDNNKLKNNGILLGNNNDQMGISLIEYALHKNTRSAVSFDVNNMDQTSSEIKVSYSFFDEDFKLISKGDSILHSIALPTEFTLMQNYPNPFNPSTTIRFTIPSNSFVRLIVYDITGKVVNEIVNGYLEPGVHNVEWSGTDAGGIDVSSGVYFYRIEASNYSKTYKMVFVK